MAKLQRNFIKGKMNKSLDERLVPNGEYIDALNVRVGSTELSEVGVIENSKGNIRLTTLDLVAKDRITLQLTSYPLSSDAKCIGAYEDSANETIYWFITDPSHTGPQVTGKLDLIVSFDVNDNSVTYHVVSVDDGGGVNTSLNFNSDYLITGVDKVDDLLFFTDDLNQPRMIDVTRDYPVPGYVGGLPTEPYLDSLGSPTFFAESLLVIKKPPVNSPTFTLTNLGAEQNFLEDRFICFAYRYRYENDMYSATSQFSDPAFIPKSFDYDNSSYLNEGMVNSFDTALITINSGSKLVVGIDLLFKEASNPVIRVIEKLNKEELGIGDNQDYTYQFSNNKIYTILDDNEILRLYDNVPLKAKAQTVMGSRLVYGNYLEGYDVDETQLRYTVNSVSEEIGVTPLNTRTESGFYDVISSGVSPAKPDSVFIIDFSNILSSSGPGLNAGSRIVFSITFNHNSFSIIGLANPINLTPSTTVSFFYTLQQDFNNIQDLFLDLDFREKMGVDSSVKPVVDSCSGVTFTDVFNCSIDLFKIDGNSDVYTKEGSGISQPIPVQGVLDPNVYTGSVPSPTFNSNEIAIQLPASVYVKNGTIASKVAEYYEITNISAQFQAISETSSLHSNRDYEIGIIYMDDFNRSTTVLVSPNNIVHIPCKESIKKNFLQVTIEPEQVPPAWAKRYKFAIKQDKDLYETIYSSIYFRAPATSDSYFFLEGENAQKVTEGDILTVKRDSFGPVSRCTKITVLEKEAKEEDFIVYDGQNVFVPPGVYMKVRDNNFAIDFNSGVFLDPPLQSVDYNSSSINVPTILLYEYLNFDSNNNLVDNFSVPFQAKVIVEIDIFKSFDPLTGFPDISYNLTKEYVSTADYVDIIEWWDGDNIKDTIGTATYVPTLATFINAPGFFFADVPIGTTGAGGVVTSGPFFRWYRETDGRIYFLIGGFINCRINCKFTIVNAGAVIIFETQPQDTAPDIWYESPVSYPITGGFHEGNVQNQTALLPAIINTEFQNCFSFGNGAESYKIRDSITRSTFGLGNRTSSVLKGEEFKQVRKFADLTYSGIYNYNINNFNEFNLGLLNFKALEPSFGLIQKIFARKTDILVLQEDKISYVLAGKNLLSDSAAGGVVTSAPDVLGTQIARIEEYGIGANAESFSVYGYDKYFTDSKRGVVVQLKGSAYSNEQLIVISDFGMSSWFRDLFLDYPNTQKLGGYDPYAKEYVLVSNQTLLPIEEEIIDGGTKKTVTADEETPVSQTINLGPYVGDAILTYSVKDITNEFLLRVEYDSVNYDTSLTSTTLGTVTIPKTSVNPQTAILSVTSVTALSDSSIELDVQLNKPEAPILKIIQVCVSDSNEGLETIHNEYQWTSGTFISPLHSEFVSLKEGTDSPLVSQYNEITGQQGGGIAPINGATVEIISKKYQSDNFVFDNTVNSFGYLRSSTLYSNTPTDIANLIAASTSVPPVGSGSVFSGSFTMPTSTDEYLYLIYDYRKPVAITLCYSNTSADDACCTCGVSATYYINAPILQEATAVYTSAALTTKAADGWYSYEGVYRKQTSGVLETSILCSACNLSCGTTLLISTLGGYYTINADLGATTGAVVIDIDFKTLPDGVKVVYDGVTYNVVYSPNFGYLSSTGTEPLYGGITAFDCGISGTTYPALSKFQFNGNGFNATGEVESVTVDPASVQLQASGLGTCKIIIPKTAASPSTAEITIISPCESAEIDIDVFCPAALPSFLLTRTGPEPTNVSGLCSASVDATFYHVVVNGTAGNPAVGDIMYQDANGSAVALAGFYAVVTYPTSAAVIEVDANGIIINSILACVP
jgi:hypothetical protein